MYNYEFWKVSIIWNVIFLGVDYIVGSMEVEIWKI